MTGTTDTRAAPTATSRSGNRIYEIITAISMTVGRGAAARMIADHAVISDDDRVVDVGCGPGTAVREAARRGATAIGVDPSPLMLRFGRRITAAQRVRNATLVEGSAEAMPVADGSATIVWALSSAHHWADRSAGLSEARRVLAPGGRIMLAERLVQPGVRGHAAHGLTRDQADQLGRDLQSAGFADVHSDTLTVRRRAFVVIRGSRRAVQ